MVQTHIFGEHAAHIILIILFHPGTERFCEDIRDMIGFRPGMYWRVCWRYIAPIFLLFIIVYGLLDYEPLQYEGYLYPWWANALGWGIAGSSVMCIPTVAIFKLLTTKGTFFEVGIVLSRYLLFLLFYLLWID